MTCNISRSEKAFSIFVMDTQKREGEAVGGKINGCGDLKMTKKFDRIGSEIVNFDENSRRRAVASVREGGTLGWAKKNRENPEEQKVHSSCQAFNGAVFPSCAGCCV